MADESDRAGRVNGLQIFFLLTGVVSLLLAVAVTLAYHGGDSVARVLGTEEGREQVLWMLVTVTGLCFLLTTVIHLKG